MKSLIKLENNKIEMTSRDIAEWFEKQHGHVLRDIREECASCDINLKCDNPYFGESSYTNNQNKLQSQIILTKKGILLIGARYDSKLRMALIEKIEELENKPQSRQELLALAVVEANNYIEELNEQFKIDKPFSNFAKAIANSSDSISIGAFAKILKNDGIKLGRNKLFAWLRRNEYLIRSGREKNNAKQRYIEQGLFEIKESVVHTVKGDILTATTLMTGKGQIYFLSKLK
jgi:phage antirepressor YoqD-like protein